MKTIISLLLTFMILAGPALAQQQPKSGIHRVINHPWAITAEGRGFKLAKRSANANEVTYTLARSDGAKLNLVKHIIISQPGSVYAFSLTTVQGVVVTGNTELALIRACSQ